MHVSRRVTVIFGQKKTAFDVISEYENIPCKVAGRVPRRTSPGALDLDSVIPRAEQRNIPTASCYGIVAADEAIRHAGLTFKTEEQSCRAGTFNICCTILQNRIITRKKNSDLVCVLKKCPKNSQVYISIDQK